MVLAVGLFPHSQRACGGSWGLVLSQPTKRAPAINSNTIPVNAANLFIITPLKT
jgi:hypothetical protein